MPRSVTPLTEVRPSPVVRITDAGTVTCINLKRNTPLQTLFTNCNKPVTLREAFRDISIAAVESDPDLYPQLSEPDLRIVQTNAIDYIKILRSKSNTLSTLTCDEAAAIYAYTLENGPYSVMNKLLRNKDTENLKPFVEYIWLFMHGLRKCPESTERMVYRGVKDDVSSQYVEENTVVWSSFSSCTTNAKVLENEMFLGKSGPRTEFRITLKSNRARSVRHLSQYPEESEVLLPPNTRFLVKETADRGNGLHIVQLDEELECNDLILKFDDRRGKGAIEMQRMCNCLVFVPISY